MQDHEVFQSALACWCEHDAWQKARNTLALSELVEHPDFCFQPAPTQLAHLQPGRPPRPRLVPPRDLPRRALSGGEGHGAFIHAICHIEFSAINLALDAALRFDGMPVAYYHDWLKVAIEEAQHFSWLAAHLAGLGYQYGDFDAHEGLWAVAENTRHDLLARMALVPRVLEARGLDVTPAMIARLLEYGDNEGAAILEKILRDEIKHVGVGTRWFLHVALECGHEPYQAFRDLVEAGLGVRSGAKLNISARREAGFTAAELAWLRSR